MRILYVQRDCRRPADRRSPGGCDPVTALLRTRHAVDTHLTLSPEVIRRIETGDYDVLITHMPFDSSGASTDQGRMAFYQNFYGGSIAILHEIRSRRPEVMIIIYTGADRLTEVTILFEAVCDHLVWKGEDEEEDAAELLKLIESNAGPEHIA